MKIKNSYCVGTKKVPKGDKKAQTPNIAKCWKFWKYLVKCSKYKNFGVTILKCVR